MPDDVAVIDDVESLEDLAEAEAPVTPAGDDAATLKRRLAGKDQALTRIQQERDAIKAERDQLSSWKAQVEQTNMTELEKAQARIAALEVERQTAVEAATRLRLEREFPLSFQILGDKTPLDDAVLTEIESRLAALPKQDEPEPEPRVDRNQPRRTAPAPARDETGDELQARLAEMTPPEWG